MKTDTIEYSLALAHVVRRPYDEIQTHPHTEA
jgi:hypothetical protein